MRLIAAFFALLVLALVIVFAVANNGFVTVSLRPFPFAAELPLFALPLIGLIAGLLAGAVIAGVRGFRLRHRLRAAERRARVLERALEETREEAGARAANEGAGAAAPTARAIAAPHPPHAA